jgi:DNA repair exonuclease SbcCD nuclease subunit
VKLLLFTDVHHGVYSEGTVDPETGLNTRLLDTLNVWDWILELAQTHRVDAVGFLGDRFRLKNPPNWMVTLADARVQTLQRNGFRVFFLVGNHDWMDRGYRWHTYGNIELWNTTGETPPPIVFRHAGSIDFDGIRLCMLPYGVTEFGEDFTSETDPNILFFHNEIVGVSEYGRGRPSVVGLPKTLIDRPEFAQVYGGHIHLQQSLALENTVGYHIGTPLERLEDGDQGPKGAWVVTIDSDGIDNAFIESPFPKIRTHTIELPSLDDMCDARPWANDLLSLTVVAPPGTPLRAWRRDLYKYLTEEAKCRSVALTLQHEQAASEDVKLDYMAVTSVPLVDQLHQYASAKHPDVLELPQVLTEIIHGTHH